MADGRFYTAAGPCSPVRMRMTSSTGSTQILPSPTAPVRAALQMMSTIPSTCSSAQILGIVVTVAIVLVLDLVIVAVVKALFRGSLRVDEADEALGLDASQHGESAYPSFGGLD